MRKSDFIFLYCFIFFSGFLSISITAQESKDMTNDIDLYVIEYENTWDGKITSVKPIYALVDEKDFTPEIIKRIVIAFSKKFPSAEKLSVKLFTEAVRLKQTKYYYKPGISISFADTAAGREAAQRYEEERTPKNIGFYADYYRTLGKEELKMTLAKDDIDLVLIELE